jgi:hypothetical protein
MRICGRPGCWKAATRRVMVHTDKRSMYIDVCEEDGEYLRQRARSRGIPTRRDGLPDPR